MCSQNYAQCWIMQFLDEPVHLMFAYKESTKMYTIHSFKFRSSSTHSPGAVADLAEVSKCQK